MKRILITLPLFLALCSCATKESGADIITERDTTFTGRANTDETLLTATVRNAEGRLKGVTVTVGSGIESIEALRLSVDGKELGSVAAKAGKTTYRFRCNAALDTASRVRVSADIAAEAAEGSCIGADITSIRFEGAEAVPEAPEAGCREVLLARTCLFMPGDYGSKNYRIPALCTLPDGSLLTATDKRKYNETDLPEDIDIVARRSTDGGHSWSEPVTIIEGKGFGKGYGDAILAVAQDGTMVCGFCGGAGLWRSTAENPQQNWVSLSKDNGQTWSEPIDITAMQWGPQAKNPECRTSHSAFFGSGHGLVLSKGPHAGRILFVTAIATKDNRLDNYAMWSDDNGQTWDISTLAYKGGDEAKVIELADGSVLMSIRQRGNRGWNISTDGGETWGEQQKWEEICTNACDGDIIRYDDQTILHSLPNDMKRRNVSIFVSKDEGKTWPYVKSICPYNSIYSSMTILPDGTIGAYIEENPDGPCEMWFMNFSMDWLMKQ